VQQADVLQRVRSALEASRIDVESSQLTAASRSSLEDHLVMVSDFLLLMAQLTLVVGALGLASTMSLAVQERTREIGVLRAIGATPRAIKTLVQMEGLTIALLSWALAIPLSLAVSVLLERAFGRILFSVTPTGLPHGGAVLIWLAVDAIVSLLACAWPAARATRIPTVAALAYE
jgi:putative ABC transport system permease protein